MNQVKARKILNNRHKKESKYVQAVKDYVVTSTDASLLSFRKHDIIKLSPAAQSNDTNTFVPHGWLRGATLDNRRIGLFPIEYVRPLTRADRAASVTPPLPQLVAPSTGGMNSHQMSQSVSGALTRMNECYGTVEEEPVRIRPSDVASAQPNQGGAVVIAAAPTTAIKPITAAPSHHVPPPGYFGHELDAAPLQKTPQQDGHFSMMEFAMMNFKQSIDK